MRTDRKTGTARALSANCVPPPGIKRALFALLCLAAGFTLGCRATGIGDKDDPFDDLPPVLKGFPLSTHNLVLFKDAGTITLSALLTPEEAVMAEVEWTADPADAVSLAADGAHVTVTPSAEGTATITATLKPREGFAFDEASTLSSECRVTVIDGFALVPTDAAVTGPLLFFTSDTGTQGVEIDLDAYQRSALTAVADIAWEVVQGGAAVITGESSGVSAAVGAGSAGQAAVRATLSAKNAAEGESAPDFNGDQLNASFAVKTLGVPTFTISDINETMLNAGTGSGAHQAFPVTAYYPPELDGYTPAPVVAWSSSDTAKATIAPRAADPISGGSAHGEGVAKAAGTPVIRATLSAAGRTFATVSTTVNIVGYVEPAKPVASVSLSGAPSTVKQTMTSAVITAKALDSGGGTPDNTNINWSSSSTDGGAVSIANVDAGANERKIQITGTAPGTVTVVAAAADNKKAQFTVTVQKPVVSWVGAAQTPFVYGSSSQIEATTDVTDKAITWTLTTGSSAAQIAPVSAGSAVMKITGTNPVTTNTKITVQAAATVNTSVTITKDIEMQPHKFNIKYDINGGTAGSTAQQNNVTYGNTENLAANGFSKTGYDFDFWSTAAGGTTKVSKISDLDANALAKTPGGTVTLFAIWKVKTYTVSYAANGGGGQMTGEALAYGATHNLKANGFSAPGGKAFKEWSVGGVSKQPGNAITVTADVRVDAVWEDVYQVTFNAGEGTGSMAAATVRAGQSYTLPANGFSAPDGQLFKEWSVSGISEGKAPGASITPSANVTVTAIWEYEGPPEEPEDLMVKFGIKTDGYMSNYTVNLTVADVTAVFNAIHTYIQTATQSGSGDRLKLGDIALGDYINLRSLYLSGSYVTNPIMIDGTDERFLRVMVVGINSYKGLNGNGNENHLVFQFKNLFRSVNGVPSRMNASKNTNSSADGGYGGSEMRTALTGTFYSALVHSNTGIPASVIWAPNRIVGEHVDAAYEFVPAQTITDKVWLPTLWEVTGSNQYSGGDATWGEENSGRLTYYSSAARRGHRLTESKGSGDGWFLASPIESSRMFARVNMVGNITDSIEAHSGVIPAFCIK